MADEQADDPLWRELEAQRLAGAQAMKEADAKMPKYFAWEDELLKQWVGEWSSAFADQASAHRLLSELAKQRGWSPPPPLEMD